MVEGHLGNILSGDRGGEGSLFRSYFPDRIDAASRIVATLARSLTTIYVAQNDNNAQKARSQWTFSFGVPGLLPQGFSEQGVILAVLYLDRKDGSGKILLIGLDSKLHTCYIFRGGANNVNTVVWREDIAGQLGSSFVARQYSDQWHALCLNNEKTPSSFEITLDLGCWEQVERARPKFYQRKCREVWKERKLKIRLLVAERWLGSQRIHDVRFQLE